LALSTHCDELQVDKANKTEVEVVTHCDELQVNKVDRTEVEVVTHCNELQVNKVVKLTITYICLSPNNKKNLTNENIFYKEWRH
jgi:hypothetical protein